MVVSIVLDKRSNKCANRAGRKLIPHRCGRVHFHSLALRCAAAAAAPALPDCDERATVRNRDGLTVSLPISSSFDETIRLLVFYFCYCFTNIKNKQIYSIPQNHEWSFTVLETLGSHFAKSLHEPT